MFRLEFIEHLWALLIIPLIYLIYRFSKWKRRQSANRLGVYSSIQKLFIGYSPKRNSLKTNLLLLAVLFIIIGLTNPQWGMQQKKVQRKSADILIALDVSNSMLADDISPNRLERARQFAYQLVEAFKGERIGLILFAGEAFLQTPLTTDYAAANIFIKSAEPELIQTQGTAIAEAIQIADQVYKDDQNHHKALFIITDGENHDQTAVETAQMASEKGLFIYGIGIGSTQGGFIPISNPQTGVETFKEDKKGQLIRTKLNEEALSQIAKAGNGTYYNINSGEEQIINALKNHISRMDKMAFEDQIFKAYNSYFQYFIGIGLIFLLVDFFLPFRKIVL